MAHLRALRLDWRAANSPEPGKTAIRSLRSRTRMVSDLSADSPPTTRPGSTSSLPKRYAAAPPDVELLGNGDVHRRDLQWPVNVNSSHPVSATSGRPLTVDQIELEQLISAKQHRSGLLDTLPRLSDHPAKPCEARPWMSAGGFVVSASANTRPSFGTMRSTRTWSPISLMVISRSSDCRSATANDCLRRSPALLGYARLR